MPRNNQFLSNRALNRAFALLAFSIIIGANPPCALAQGFASLNKGVRPPLPINRIKPQAPDDVKDFTEDVMVEVYCWVDEEGKVTQTELKSTERPEFTEAAMDALKQWQFRPGSREGEPSAMKIVVPLKFKAPSPEEIQILAYQTRINEEMGRDVYTEMKGSLVLERMLSAPLKFRKRPRLRYPDSLKRSGKEGIVKITYVVTPEGKVINPRVIGYSDPVFQEASIKTAARLDYRPPKHNGRPVNATTTTQFVFSPKRTFIFDEATQRKAAQIEYDQPEITQEDLDSIDSGESGSYSDF